MDFAVNEGHGVADESVMVPAEEQKEVKLFEKFLPPRPKEKCSDELQVSGDSIIFQTGTRNMLSLNVYALF